MGRQNKLARNLRDDCKIKNTFNIWMKILNEEIVSSMICITYRNKLYLLEIISLQRTAHILCFLAACNLFCCCIGVFSSCFYRPTKNDYCTDRCLLTKSKLLILRITCVKSAIIAVFITIIKNLDIPRTKSIINVMLRFRISVLWVSVQRDAYFW